MYSDGDLDAAVAAGALSPEAAERFRAHVARQRVTPAADEEQFRLLTGFNDIFVSIAASMVLVAIAEFAWHGSPIEAAAGVALASWGMAEFFTRRRRMALPSILLLFGFTAGIAGLALAVIIGGPIFELGGSGLVLARESWRPVAAAAVTTLAVSVIARASRA